MNLNSHHFIMCLCWLSRSPSSPMRSRTAEEACCSKAVPSPLRLNLTSHRTWTTCCNTTLRHFKSCLTFKVSTLTLSQSRSLWVCRGCNTPRLCPTVCFSCYLAVLPHLAARFFAFHLLLERTPPGGHRENYMFKNCNMFVVQLLCTKCGFATTVKEMSDAVLS